MAGKLDGVNAAEFVKTIAEWNKAVRTELKSRVKGATVAAAEGAADADDQLRIAQKRLNMAGAKGRIHPRQASRRTSRLMRRAAKGAQT